MNKHLLLILMLVLIPFISADINLTKKWEICEIYNKTNISCDQFWINDINLTIQLQDFLNLSNNTNIAINTSDLLNKTTFNISYYINGSDYVKKSDINLSEYLKINDLISAKELKDLNTSIKNDINTIVDFVNDNQQSNTGTIILSILVALLFIWLGLTNYMLYKSNKDLDKDNKKILNALKNETTNKI